MLDNFKGAFGLWNIVRGISSAELRRQMELSVIPVLVGDSDEVSRLSFRLGSPSAVERIAAGEPVTIGPGRIVFDAAKLNSLPDAQFDVAITEIAAEFFDRRIALAYRIPALRPIIVHQLSHARALENAKIAAISALPGIFPMTDWLMPATAMGDLLILTRNQIMLLLEVAACFGRPPETKARVKELLPIVGSAFGWRAVARELVGLVPGGVGLLVKSAVAYAGTYSVGRAAAFYYSGQGLKAGASEMRAYYRGALQEGFTRAKALIGRS